MAIQQGMSSQTPAVRHMVNKAMGKTRAAGGTRKRRSSGKKKAAGAKGATTKRKSKLKFGSPAWRKKYMKKK